MHVEEGQNQGLHTKSNMISQVAENTPRLDNEKIAFTSPQPNSKCMFGHTKNLDGSLRPSKAFAAWCDHEHDDGKHLLEEGDVVGEE